MMTRVDARPAAWARLGPPQEGAVFRPLQQALRDLADALDAAEVQVGDARAADRLVGALYQNVAAVQSDGGSIEELDGTLALVLLEVLESADVPVLPLLAEYGLLDG